MSDFPYRNASISSHVPLLLLLYSYTQAIIIGPRSQESESVSSGHSPACPENLSCQMTPMTCSYLSIGASEKRFGLRLLSLVWTEMIPHRLEHVESRPESPWGDQDLAGI